MGKLNCWNFKGCGRYPGGPKESELGVCPAATATEADGYLGGRNGGRACMYITGTFCGGTIQGTAQEKEKNCSGCEYYQMLKKKFGQQVSVLEFSKYVEGPKTVFTPADQPWDEEH